MNVDCENNRKRKKIHGFRREMKRDTLKKVGKPKGASYKVKHLIYKNH